MSIEHIFNWDNVNFVTSPQFQKLIGTQDTFSKKLVFTKESILKYFFNLLNTFYRICCCNCYVVISLILMRMNICMNSLSIGGLFCHFAGEVFLFRAMVRLLILIENVLRLHFLHTNYNYYVVNSRTKGSWKSVHNCHASVKIYYLVLICFLRPL